MKINRMCFRSANKIQYHATRVMILPHSVKEEDRSVEIKINSPKEVRVFDWDRWEVIDEILLSEGAEFDRQLPLLNNHRRVNDEDLIGSVVDIKLDGENLTGRAVYSSDPVGQRVYIKVKEGHLRDTSVGYWIYEWRTAEPGETITVSGKNYSARTVPLRVVTKWRIIEVSMTPIGANAETKVREGREMNDFQKALAAYKEGHYREAITLFERYLQENPDHAESKQKIEDAKRHLAFQEAPAQASAPERQQQNTKVQEETQRAIQEERKRVAEITVLGRKHDFDVQKYIENGSTIDHVRAAILDAIATRRDGGIVPPAPIVDVIVDRQDKTRNYVENSLCMRMGLEAPHKDQESGQQSLLRLAEEVLNARGIATRHMSKNQIAMEAMKRAHSTGDFPLILSNSINKRLQRAYEETPTTYQVWISSEEVEDFKENEVSQLSEGPDLDLVPEGADYPEGSFEEKREKFKVEKFGRIFHITWEALVNDDLRAFDRISRQFGIAAARKVDASVYALLTGNPAMADGVTLFHANHKNLIAVGTALSVDNLGVARALMRKQTGLSSSADAILNIEPTFLIVPAALETSAFKMVASTMVPGEENAMNPFRGTLSVIPCARLDASSATAWYLASNPNVQEHIQVAFLQGFRKPQVIEEDGFTSDTRKFRVKQVFKAKAIDHRGIMKNPGA